MKDVFARCFKKIAIQEDRYSSMYSNYCAFTPYILMHSRIMLLFQGILFIILISVNFHRLKINHDTHEFILESGTIMNTYLTAGTSFYLKIE
jgi:hypothetical protein